MDSVSSTEPCRSQLEVIDRGEIWEFDGASGDDHFAYTSLIMSDRGSDKIFCATTMSRLSSLQSSQIPVSTNIANLTEIPPDHIYPQIPAKYSVFAREMTNEIYYKRPRLLSYGQDSKKDAISITVLNEVHNYERLQIQPCEFLAKYYGCLVSSGRIIAIVLEKYECTLADRVRNGPLPLLPDLWLKQILFGVHHLHDQGLAHNDLNPWNIMLKGDQVAIIDFDSCAPLGELLDKEGTLDWSDPQATVSAISNDDYSLNKLEKFLFSHQRS